ncbi:MAG: DUF962 domain-containing protein [Deltaproteobacteria bacterium]|nr:DUF962 domain-containing protein [Deltaproteobacteria bacterium]
MADRISNYRDFWPFYVGEHLHPATRWMHFVGTNGVVALLVLAVVSRDPRLLVALPVCGYGFAWVSHFFIEKNRPATFTYARWSLAADFHMCALMWAGKMQAEVEKVRAARATTR